jgi:hypothetical protein
MAELLVNDEAMEQCVYIDFGIDKPGMTLQREYREGRYLVWRDYEEDGETVMSPVDIDALPSGKYRLVN